MFKEQKIFIFGMARSGYEAAKVLLNRKNEVLIVDSNTQNKEHVQEIEKLGGTIIITDCPEQYLDETYSYVIKNPGIRKNHTCILKAKNLNIPVINELEMSYLLLPEEITIIGITGSNGKTTTTTLLDEIFKKSDLKDRVHLGGNIGFPMSSLLSKIKKNDILLLEISDHQLCDMYEFKCNISVLTNISPTHLDFHDSYDQYKEMKKRIFNHQTPNDLAVINRSNEEAFDLSKNGKAEKKYFSSTNGSIKMDDCYLEENKIYYGIDHDDFGKEERTIFTKNIKIKGIHNYENIMAAILVAEHFQIPFSIIEEVLSNFKGVEHRLEFVLENKGITVYNDSKSTNNVSTQIALSSFKQPTLLIMGGYNRDQTYDDLIPFMSHVKKVVCYGETKEKLQSFFKDKKIDNIGVDTIKEACDQVFSSSTKGDVILFSPAHASWDQYKSFEQRGDDFKNNMIKLYEK